MSLDNNKNIQNRDFKGVWIPREIWLAKDLSWSEKNLLVEIDSLARNNECFATNEYLANFFSLSKDRISKLIASLKNKGYVEVNLIYKQGTKQIEKRIITTMGYRRKQLGGIGENNYTPIGENNEDINTSNINTFINTSSSSSENQPIEKNKTKNFGFEEEKEKSQNNTEKNIKENETLHNTIKIAKAKKGKKRERIDNELENEQYQYILEYFERVIENKVDITLKIKKDISDILALGYNVEQIKSTIDYLISYLQDKGEPEKLTTRYFLNPAYFEHNFQKFQADTMVHKRKMNSRSYDLDKYESNYDIFDEIKNPKFNNNLFDDETEDDDFDLL